QYYDEPSNIENYKKRVEKLKKVIDEIEWEPANVYDRFEYGKKLEHLFHQAVALHLCSQPHLTDTLGVKLRSALTTMLLEESIQQIILKITGITHLPATLMEQKEWLELIVDAQTRNHITKDTLRNHLSKWKYITAGDSHSPLTLNQLENRADKDFSSKEKIKGQLRKLNEICDGTIKNELANIVMTIGNEQVKYYSNIIRMLSSLRFDTKSMWMKLWYLLDENRKKIENKMGCHIHGFINEELTMENIKECMIENTRDSYLILKNPDSTKLFFNGLENKVIDSIIEKKDWIQLKFVQGMTGYEGRIKGKALKVDWNDNIEEKLQLLTEETILVIPQTTPAYMPLLNKCIGLITDEGGITSHASIVSRELQIPSIIGTKVATKVFSDGDLIEIDTSKNIAIKIALN
ncbi:MAG: PEP-utilizing enzyme, partial [bacterium]